MKGEMVGMRGEVKGEMVGMRGGNEGDEGRKCLKWKLQNEEK